MVGLSLFDSYSLESIKEETCREAIKHPKGWFDPHIQNVFKNARYDIGKPCKLGNLYVILHIKDPPKK